MSMEIDQGQGQGELNSMSATTMSSVYNDDEPLQPPPAAHATRSGVLVLTAHCEYPAVPNDADHDGFAVMVHVKAPPLVAAAPVDLVAVLDVSETMAGAKLAQVKRAMGFVVDRLSVVAFSGDGGAARRVIRLTRMTADGKAAAKLAVDALAASSGDSTTTTTTDVIRSGLDEAAKVLGDSRQRNDVTGVILVSDSGGGHGGSRAAAAVPEFFLRDSGSGPLPVHTFGLGSDDLDAAALHSISEITRGTFSFVEDAAAIQDAVARCVAGLRSVTARDACVEIESAGDANVVNVTGIKSAAGYELSGPLGDEFWLTVGELYADEERRFLVRLDVAAEDEEDSCETTSLIKVRCSYTDMASGQPVLVEPADLGDEFIEIERPDADEAAAEGGVAPRCVEVERELLRVAAAEDMALARDAAQRGDYDEAARILDARRESMSGVGDDDAMCTAVAAELHELSRRVSDEREYRKTGRACILASLRSHALQRGASSAHFGCVGSSSVFATPATRRMEKLSEMLRRRQQEAPPLPENGSKTGVPLAGSRRLEARLASAVPRLSMLSKYRRLLLKR